MQLQSLSSCSSQCSISVSTWKSIKSKVKVWSAISEWEFRSQHEWILLLRETLFLPFSIVLLIRPVILEKLHHQIWNVLMLITIELLSEITSQVVGFCFKNFNLGIFELKIIVHVGVKQGLGVWPVILLRFGSFCRAHDDWLSLLEVLPSSKSVSNLLVLPNSKHRTHGNFASSGHARVHVNVLGFDWCSLEKVVGL